MSDATTDILSLFREGLVGDDDQIHHERLLIREFIKESIASGFMVPQCDSWLSGYSAEFSREVGRHGWIGMTWPHVYGGRDLSPSFRLAVIEELLAAGAPVAAHWFSDRQIGPTLLRHGTVEQRAFFLPRMARGESFFCIGMSEADAGSDLGSVRTRAVPTTDGWIVNGSKTWTSHAQHAHYMLALVRTGALDGKPANSLTQLIINMNHPGVTVQPIRMLDGREHFCEVFLDDVFVPENQVLGEVGQGWKQVLGELGFERSGPERFLSTFPLLAAVSASNQSIPDKRETDFGSLVARMVVLRAMSGRVNHHIESTHAPGVQAAMVKLLGTNLENDSIDVAREWLDSNSDHTSDGARELCDQAQVRVPGFTLRGGTSEIMHDIIGRALDVS